MPAQLRSLLNRPSIQLPQQKYCTLSFVHMVKLSYSKTASKTSISVFRERDTTRIHLSSALKVLRVRPKQLDAVRVRTVRLSRASNRKYRLNWKTCLRKIHQSVQRESYDVNNVVTALDTLNADNPLLHVQCRAVSRSARTCEKHLKNVQN